MRSRSIAAAAGADAGFAPPRARLHVHLPAAAVRAAQGVRGRVPALLAGLAAAIPVIESTRRAVAAGWVPAGDDGIIATRGWDVVTAHTPLIGQYSEAGLVIARQVLHSPGPMLYWLIALPARFGSVASIPVTIGAVNTLAICGCVALARRRGGLVLMFATAAAIALMCQSLPTEALHDIWNPAAGLLPFLLLIFLSWSVACGDHRLLPLTVLDASFVTQTHLMYAAPAAMLLVVGLGGLLAASLQRRRRSRLDGAQRGSAWPWMLATLLVAAACWAAPAIDQIEHSPGNLATLLRTAEHPGPTLGVTFGWHAVARAVGLRPWWLYVPASEWNRKYDVRGPLSALQVDSTIAILAALALAGLIAALRRRPQVALAALIGFGLSAAIWLEVASNPSPQLLSDTLGYTMWWGSELGMWVWLILAWALWLGAHAVARGAIRRLPSHGPLGRLRAPERARRAALLVVSLAALAGTAGVGDAVAASGKPDSHAYEYRPVRQAVTAIERLIAPGQTVDLQYLSLDLATQPMEPTIRFFLVRHGDRVLASGSFARLGSYYELYRRRVDWTLYLQNGTRRPKRSDLLAARVRFNGPWGVEVLSAWAHRLTARAQHAPATTRQRPRR